MCRVLRVARSGWYVWRRHSHQPGPQQPFRLICVLLLVRHLLRRNSDHASLMNCRSTISKPLPQGGRAKASRRFSPVSYREHGLPVSENLLKQAFCASDIMYLLTDEGWQYLAVVIDLWSRVVIGWLTPQLACDALQMVLWRRRRPEQVIVHTVHDGQYCSADIRYC